MDQLERGKNYVVIVAIESAPKGGHDLEECLPSSLRQLLGLEVEQVCEQDSVLTEQVVPGKNRLVVGTLRALDAGGHQVLVVIRQKGGCLFRFQIKCFAQSDEYEFK